jgi:DNA (cytosine-5)-methyltransferase 1
MATFVSLFAGVGGFDLGLERAGHTCVGQVEIDKKCLEVLTKHWPTVAKHTDVVTAKEWADAEGLKGRVDIVCGGFPCQDVSVAGRRAGLAGERSGLFFDAVSFASHVEAKTVILENVPGLLSSNGGRDFGVVLTTLAHAGYSNIEWSVLNSQFFGVPQRRRRVFVIASTPDAGRPKVFVEQESLRGDYSESNSEGKNFARGSSQSYDEADKSGLVPFIKTVRSGARDIDGNLPPEVWEEQLVSPTLTSFDNSGEARATVLVVGFNHTQGLDIQASEDVFPTLRTGGQGNAVMTAPQEGVLIMDGTRVGDVRITESQTMQTVISRWGTGGGNVPAIMDEATIRRLTPVECERLQGFPDNWTDGQADSTRYKQMGNAVTVNVIEWVGGKI